jgi:hypothetical protein
MHSPHAPPSLYSPSTVQSVSVADEHGHQVVLLDVPHPRVVAAQIEIESKVCKRFTILKIQALKPLALSIRVLILSTCTALPRTGAPARGSSAPPSAAPSSSLPPPPRGLHSFRFQLNLSSSVHCVTQLINPECVLELLKLSSNLNECKPLPPPRFPASQSRVRPGMWGPPPLPPPQQQPPTRGSCTAARAYWGSGTAPPPPPLPSSPPRRTRAVCLRSSRARPWPSPPRMAPMTAARASPGPGFPASQLPGVPAFPHASARR